MLSSVECEGPVAGPFGSMVLLHSEKEVIPVINENITTVQVNGKPHILRNNTG